MQQKDHEAGTTETTFSGVFFQPKRTKRKIVRFSGWEAVRRRWGYAEEAVSDAASERVTETSARIAEKRPSRREAEAVATAGTRDGTMRQPIARCAAVRHLRC